MRRTGILLVALLALPILAACASSGGSSGAAVVYGAESSGEAVDRFIAAIRLKDYQTMTRLFGTRDGPAAERMGRAEIEQRMFVLAALMEHENHAVRSNTLSEGNDRLRHTVDMVGTRNGNVSVPVITVRYRDRWLVEQVITDPFTRR